MTKATVTTRQVNLSHFICLWCPAYNSKRGRLENQRPWSSTALFADDSQLLASSTPSGAADVCRRLERCLSAVHDGCTHRRLLLNPSKTEATWFGSSANLDRLADSDVTICLDQATIHPSDCIRDLGVLLDSSLSMRQHIAKVGSTCFFHLRRLRRPRRVLDLQSRSGWCARLYWRA